MAYGTIKVDNITFTSNETDETITVSGIVQSISGNLTVTGTIQGANIIGTSTVSGATVTGDIGTFTTITGGVATLTSGVFASGVAATPSISIGTVSNGFYSPAENQVALSTSGTGKLFIDSAGKVTVKGAGTAAFVVEGSAPNNSLVIKDTTGNVGIGTSSPGSLKLYVLGDTTNYGITTEAPSGYGGLTFKQTSGNAISVGMISDGLFVYDNNAGFTRLTLDSSGRLGIGTTSPQHSLSLLQGNALGWVSGVGNAKQKIEATGSDGLDFYTGGTPTLKATIDSSGRLLVGTSSARTVVAGQSRPARLQLEAAGSIAQTPIDDASIALFGGCPDTGGATSLGAPRLSFIRTNSSSIGSNAAVVNGSRLGTVSFLGTDDTGPINAASIHAEVDGTPGTNDMPGRLVFSVTADGSASQTEALRISSNRAITVSDGGNVVLGTTTGTKIGTSTSQKIGFFNETPIVQPTTGVAEAAFVENSGGTAVNVDSTFGGYTIQQVVQALQNLGLLA